LARDIEQIFTRPSRPQVYPWHAPLWQRLTRDLARTPHAILFQGASGLGKLELARRFAETLLCERPGAAACGQCRGCGLLAAGTHPDLLMVQPQEDSKIVAVDQVRALSEFFALKPHTAARKLVIVQPAEAMNANAANSLLKVLEEPPLGSVLLLVCDQPGRLPATIRSRCARLTCRAPEPKEALRWLHAQGVDGEAAASLLELAGGAPLRVQQLVAEEFHAQEPILRGDVQDLLARRVDPSVCAVRWKAVGAPLCLSWFYGLLAREIQAQMGLTTSSLQEGIKALDLGSLYEFVDVVSEARRQLTGSLDELLLLEDILIGWSRLAR
jgi:DNA polymerase-3 subunit delta'